MKVRAKETFYMEGSNDLFIIKDKIYDLKEKWDDYYFKSEFEDNHMIRNENIKDYFVIIPDKSKLCEILGVVFNKPYNIKGYEHNPIKVKYLNDKEEVVVINKWGLISSKKLVELIEHPELIEKIPEYTDEQKEIFKAFKTIGLNYIAREINNDIYAYVNKPDNIGIAWDTNDIFYIDISYLDKNILAFINKDVLFEIPTIE